MRKKYITIFTLIILFSLTNLTYIFAANAEKDSLSQAIPGENSEPRSGNTIIIGDDIDYPPYSYLDEQGNPTGFNIELAKAVAEVMGLKAEVRLGNWNEIRRQLENGEIDVISGMFYSKEREKSYSFTTKHTVTSGDVFTRKGKGISGLEELKGKTVVVQADDIVHEYLKAQNLDIEFMAVPTVAEALHLVSSGKYDYAAVLKTPGHYLINKHKLKNLVSSGLILTPNDYCMALQKGNDDLLLTLNGGLQILKFSGRYQEIYDKYLGVYEQKSLIKQLEKYKWLLGIISLGILILITWTITLRRTVAVRTRELLNANMKLQESQEELIASNEELEAYLEQLAATEEELRSHFDMLLESEKKLKISEEHNRAIVSAMPDLLFIINHEGIYLDCKARDEYNLVVPKEQLVGKAIWDVLPKDIADAYFEKIQASLNTGELYDFEFELDLSHGVRHFETRVIKSKEKEVVIISRDITQKLQAERALEEEKELLRITLLSVGDGVIATDSSGNITMLNNKAEELTGWTEKEAKSMEFEEIFQTCCEDTGERSINPIKKALDTKAVVKSEENIKLIGKNSEEILISYSVAPILDKDSNIKGTILVFRDVTAERMSQKRIEYLSYHDQVTGLYNRRFFEEELNRLNVKRNLPFTIIMADVNGLKLINDSFGHSMGDKLLKKVAEVLEKSCRADDIISRIGGDEFVILMPNVDSNEAEQIVKRIRQISSKERVASLELSISFGWETKYHEEENILDILKKAEDYMYKKKLFEGPSMRSKTIGAIINTLHEKNKREEQHSHRVSAYCQSMGKAIALSDDQVQELKTVGLLHDIGKIAIDENILNKPERLSKDEWDEIKKHPEIGYRILSSVNDMAEMADYVLAHHERWDGGGYPKGLKGDEIPLKSRIITIADAFDAMTCERAYRSAMSEDYAVSELIKNAGTQFDPLLVKIFVEKVLGKAYN
ncbi:MAG: HD domain-containing phosphohydrolase [Bacillota bacterium]